MAITLSEYFDKLDDITSGLDATMFSDAMRTLRNYCEEIIADDSNDDVVKKHCQFEWAITSLHPQSYVIAPKYLRRLPDEVDQYSHDQLEYYRNRLSKCNNDQFACLYGDILLESKAMKTGKKAIYDTIILRFEKFIHDNKYTNDALLRCMWLGYLARGVELSMKFGDSTKFKEFVAFLEATIDELGGKISYRWSIEISTIVIKVLSSSKYRVEISPELVHKAVEVLKRSQKMHFLNLLLYERFSNKLIELSKYCDDDVLNAKDVDNDLARRFEYQAENQPDHQEKSSLIGRHFFECALAKYTELGDKFKINELKNKMSDLQLEAKKTEYFSQEFKLEIPMNVLQDYIKEVYGNICDVRLAIIVFGSDPNIVVNVETCRENATAITEDCVFLSLVTNTVSTDDRTIFQADTPGKIDTLRYAQNYSLGLAMYSDLIIPKVVDVIFKMGITSSDVVDFYREWSFYNCAREKFIEKGVDYLLTGDFGGAIHVLIPQFEGCLRDMLRGFGISTIANRQGEQRERSLSELLELNVKSNIGEDFLDYIRFTLCEQLGWNLRNNVAHGLAKYDDLSAGKAYVVFHLFVKLFCIRGVSAD